MVEWTEFERDTIQDIFSKMDYESVGHNALARIWAGKAYGVWASLRFRRRLTGKLSLCISSGVSTFTGLKLL
ncbi:hypothetical protein MHYP_G00342640 [Metynnis hypsauchen]